MYRYFTCISVCASCVCACRGQRRVQDLLELELLMVVSPYVGAGNWILVFWKSNQCSELLSYLSSFQILMHFWFICIRKGRGREVGSSAGNSTCSTASPEPCKSIAWWHAFVITALLGQRGRQGWETHLEAHSQLLWSLLLLLSDKNSKRDCFLSKVEGKARTDSRK